MLTESLLSWHGMFSGFGWRKWLPDEEGICECTKLAVTGS
jgi:hypothetical protein